MQSKVIKHIRLVIKHIKLVIEHIELIIEHMVIKLQRLLIRHIKLVINVQLIFLLDNIPLFLNIYQQVHTLRI